MPVVCRCAPIRDTQSSRVRRQMTRQRPAHSPWLSSRSRCRPWRAPRLGPLLRRSSCAPRPVVRAGRSTPGRAAGYGMAILGRTTPSAGPAPAVPTGGRPARASRNGRTTATSVATRARSGTAKRMDGASTPSPTGTCTTGSFATTSGTVAGSSCGSTETGMKANSATTSWRVAGSSPTRGQPVRRRVG